jgi:hypothetical protein
MTRTLVPCSLLAAIFALYRVYTRDTVSTMQTRVSLSETHPRTQCPTLPPNPPGIFCNFAVSSHHDGHGPG